MGVSKNRETPPNHEFVHRVFHDFHHPFWWFSPYFLFISHMPKYISANSKVGGYRWFPRRAVVLSQIHLMNQIFPSSSWIVICEDKIHKVGPSDRYKVGLWGPYKIYVYDLKNKWVFLGWNHPIYNYKWPTLHGYTSVKQVHSLTHPSANFSSLLADS